MVKEIPLTQGKVALVSDSSYKELIRFQWRAKKIHKVWYATRKEKGILGTWGIVYMHRQIMNTPKGMDTDHIDGDGLNNQIENLRICSHSENLMNSRIRSDNTSGYKGIWFNKKGNKWAAEIHFGGKKKFLGYFTTKQDAAIAYQAASVEIHGEFSRLY